MSSYSPYVFIFAVWNHLFFLLSAQKIITIISSSCSKWFPNDNPPPFLSNKDIDTTSSDYGTNQNPNPNKESVCVCTHINFQQLFWGDWSYPKYNTPPPPPPPPKKLTSTHTKCILPKKVHDLNFLFCQLTLENIYIYITYIYTYIYVCLPHFGLEITNSCFLRVCHVK